MYKLNKEYILTDLLLVNIDSKNLANANNITLYIIII